jgi:hypothetical protein
MKRERNNPKTKKKFEAIATGGEPSQALTGLFLSPNVRGGGLLKRNSMPKRLTDTAKWCDPWFRKLPPKYKSLLCCYFTALLGPTRLWDWWRGFF